MTDIAGLTYYELDFNADGTLSSDGGLPAAVQARRHPGRVRAVARLEQRRRLGPQPVPGDVHAAGRDDPGQAGLELRGRHHLAVAAVPQRRPGHGSADPVHGPADSRRYRAGVPGAAAERRYARPATGPAAAGPGRAGAVPHAGVQPGHYSPARARGLRSGGRHHRRHRGRVRQRRSHVEDARLQRAGPAEPVQRPVERRRRGAAQHVLLRDEEPGRRHRPKAASGRCWGNSPRPPPGSAST